MTSMCVVLVGVRGEGVGVGVPWSHQCACYLPACHPQTRRGRKIVTRAIMEATRDRMPITLQVLTVAVKWACR